MVASIGLLLGASLPAQAGTSDAPVTTPASHLQTSTTVFRDDFEWCGEVDRCSFDETDAESHPHVEFEYEAGGDWFVNGFETYCGRRSQSCAQAGISGDLQLVLDLPNPVEDASHLDPSELPGMYLLEFSFRTLTAEPNEVNLSVRNADHHLDSQDCIADSVKNTDGSWRSFNPATTVVNTHELWEDQRYQEHGDTRCSVLLPGENQISFEYTETEDDGTDHSVSIDNIAVTWLPRAQWFSPGTEK